MKWPSLRAVRVDTDIHFVQPLARKHHFVQLQCGLWTRTLGPPAGCVPLSPRSRTWKQVSH